MNTEKPLLIGVSDVFFYTKIRDAFRPQGYTLQRLRKQEDILEKVSSLQPLAVIINMNDDQINTRAALQTLKGHETYKHIPVLAFANHEEVEIWRQAKDLGINKIVSRNEFSSRTLALVEELIGPNPTP
ncbi:MAG: histidine kinase [Nitrospirota bacterium]|nr:MAG: histidine kinase [Nitrospirota bacterium]